VEYLGSFLFDSTDLKSVAMVITYSSRSVYQAGFTTGFAPNEKVVIKRVRIKQRGL